jgi:transposase
MFFLPLSGFLLKFHDDVFCHACMTYRRTIMLRRVCSTRNAKSVPDEVFQRAKGVLLHESQSYQCESASFEGSISLTRFSEHIIAERAPLPYTARMICERHQLGLVPVMRVIMARKKKTFKFYIIGMSKEIYAESYPTKSCWASFCGLF